MYVLVRGYRHCAVNDEGVHTEHAYFPQLPIWQPLQLGQRRLADDAPIRRCLLVAEELHWHELRP
jgi:hypothetical protein